MIVRLRLILVAVAALFAGAGGVACARSPEPPRYELAEAYFRKGNFASAYLIALPAGHAGDPRAQYLLGLMSQRGLPPVTRDLDEAVRWFGHAAHKGHGDAQYALAQAFARGEGVPVDKARAIAWLERAAQGGHTMSIMSLARLHDEGIDFPRDRTIASGYVKRAAELGDTKAQVMFGERLAAGIGLDPDPEAGDRWILRAAELGEPLALIKLARRPLDKEGAQPSEFVAAHAYATFAEQKAEGELKDQATALKSDLAQRMTPTDLANAADKLKSLTAPKRS
ncbi:MAG: sel1 repeat family protein [Alphaproteobacteria bacterium]|nr:sel1 repeat family protein [Alphaproteobacteria bacterium]